MYNDNNNNNTRKVVTQLDLTLSSYNSFEYRWLVKNSTKLLYRLSLFRFAFPFIIIIIFFYYYCLAFRPVRLYYPDTHTPFSHQSIVLSRYFCIARVLNYISAAAAATAIDWLERKNKITSSNKLVGTLSHQFTNLVWFCIIITITGVLRRMSSVLMTCFVFNGYRYIWKK